MSSLTGLWQVKLVDMLEELGEDVTHGILATFSCPLNKDVEFFLREKAILFVKSGFAATHLVFTSYQNQTVLVGYYALATKTVVIKGRDLNSRWRHRLNNFATYNPETKQYLIALPLIGQLSKNFANGYDKLISGNELLAMACDRIRKMQLEVGGKMAYLECEDHPKLIEFYESNGFYRFANRQLDKDELQTGEKPYLVQMLRYFSSKENDASSNSA